MRWYFTKGINTNKQLDYTSNNEGVQNLKLTSLIFQIS